MKMKLKCHETGSAQHPLSKASLRKFISVIDIILIMFLQKLFFTAAILLCAVRDVQWQN